MRIVFVGLGGVGGMVGGKLLAGLAGAPEHEIIFWCRGETLAAVKENGLKVSSNDGEFTVRPSLATCSADEVKTADLLVFAVKNYHLETAIRDLAPLANSKTIVLPLLNGVSALETLEKQLPQCDTLGGCAYVFAHAERPGVIKQAGALQRIVFGKKGISEAENLTRYGAIEQVLKKSGFDITLTEKIDVAMWSKLVFLSPLAGVTTLSNRSVSEVLAHEESFETLKQLLREIENLARAKNIALPEDVVETSLERAHSLAPFSKTSMQLDHENGRQTELESLIGYICREGKAMGVSIPTYEKVYDGLKRICKV